MNDATAARPQGIQPPIEGKRELTPYQLSLAALTFPWASHCLFNLAAGASLALIGAPRLATASAPAVRPGPSGAARTAVRRRDAWP